MFGPVFIAWERRTIRGNNQRNTIPRQDTSWGLGIAAGG